MAFAVFAVGGFVRVRASWVAEVVAIGVSPEGGVDDFDVVFRNEFGIVVVFLVETFLEGVVHGIDGGFAVVVAAHGVEVGFLDEEKKKK